MKPNFTGTEVDKIAKRHDEPHPEFEYEDSGGIWHPISNHETMNILKSYGWRIRPRITPIDQRA